MHCLLVFRAAREALLWEARHVLVVPPLMLSLPMLGTFSLLPERLLMH